MVEVRCQAPSRLSPPPDAESSVALLPVRATGSFHQPCLLGTLWCQLPTNAKQNCLISIFIIITTVFIIIISPRQPCRGPSCPPPCDKAAPLS